MGDLNPPDRDHPIATATAARVPTSMVLLLSCAAGVAVGNVYLAQPVLDLLASAFAMSQASVGWVVTVTQVGCALALLFVVPLGDRYERRRMLTVLAGLLSLSLVVTGLATATPVLLAGSVALGLLGTAVTQSLIASGAAMSSPEERGRVVGAAQGGVVVGILLARTLAGFIADHWGWRSVFLFNAVLVLVLGAVLARALPRMPASGGALSYRQLLLTMAKLVRIHPTLPIRGMIGLLVFASFGIFWSSLALYLSGPAFAMSHTAIGSFGFVGAVSALAATRAGRLADQGYAQWTTGLGLLVLSASWLPMSLAGASVAWLIIGIVLLDLAGQAVHVTNQWFVLRLDPTAHRRLVGCYMLFYAAGLGGGGVLATLVYDSYGWPGVCLLGGGISLSGLLFWLMTRTRMQSAAVVGQARV